MPISSEVSASILPYNFISTLPDKITNWQAYSNGSGQFYMMNDIIYMPELEQV